MEIFPFFPYPQRVYAPASLRTSNVLIVLDHNRQSFIFLYLKVRVGLPVCIEVYCIIGLLSEIALHGENHHTPLLCHSPAILARKG
jgi:hypothetical protein